MRYQAVFLVPSGARKRLREFGWEIESDSRLSDHVLEVLTRELGLRTGQSWGDVDVRESPSVKLSTERGPDGGIEHIYGQLRGTPPDTIRTILHAAGFDQVEVFFPSEIPA
jgi:hypothetical protein